MTRSLTLRARRLLALLLVLVLPGCAGVTQPDGVQIRFRNGGTVELTDIVYRSGDASVDMARLAPGAQSEYSRHASTYSYGYLRFTANGGIQVLQPIDFVGETPITRGSWTFTIVPAAVAGGSPQLVLARD